jgi:hypothetical protein
MRVVTQDIQARKVVRDLYGLVLRLEKLAFIRDELVLKAFSPFFVASLICLLDSTQVPSEASSCSFTCNLGSTVLNTLGHIISSAQ